MPADVHDHASPPFPHTYKRAKPNHSGQKGKMQLDCIQAIQAWPRDPAKRRPVAGTAAGPRDLRRRRPFCLAECLTTGVVRASEPAFGLVGFAKSPAVEGKARGKDEKVGGRGACQCRRGGGPDSRRWPIRMMGVEQVPTTLNGCCLRCEGEGGWP